MPTQVKAPDIASTRIPQLQAVVRPEGKQLGGYLAEVLPQIAKGFQAYQDENRDHLIAQGMNDEINGVQRDVSIFDRWNYNQGMEFQKVSSSQAAKQAQFTTDIDQMAKDGKTEDEIYNYGQQFLRESTDLIANSKLAPALKQSLYEANLQENSSYHKIIGDKIREVARGREVFDANTRAASAATLWQGGNFTPEEMAGNIEAYVQKAYAAKTAANVGIAPEEAMKAAQSEVTSIFKFWKGSIDPSDPNAGDYVNKLNNTMQVALQNGIISMDTLLDLQTGANDLRTGILNYNEVQAQNAQDELLWGIQSGNQEYSHDIVVQQVARINDLETKGMISPESARKMRSGLFTFGEQQYDKQLKADLDPVKLIQNGTSLQAFHGLGKGGEDKYSDTIAQGYDRMYNGDPVQSGLQMVAHGLKGDPNGEALPSLLRQGTAKLSSQFVNFLSMPQDQAAKLPNYQNASQAFEGLKANYIKLKTQGSPLADDLLAGIPEDQRGVVKGIFENGGNMNSANQSIANAPQYNQRVANVKTAIEGMRWDDKMENVRGKSFLGYHYDDIAGDIGKRLGSDLRGAFMNNLRMVYGDSAHALANGTTSPDPELLVANAKAKGLHVKSQSGYSDALFTSTAAEQYSNITYKGVKLSKDYIGYGVDSLREQVAKNFKTKPENVLVYTSRNGNQIVVQPFDSNGKLLSGGSSNGVVFNRADLVQRMQKAYDGDVKKYQGQTRTFETVGQSFKDFGKTLSSTLNYKDQIAAMRANERPSYQVNTGATLGRVPVRIGNTTSNVNLPAMASVPFNGNVQLANAWQSFLGNYEGFLDRAKVVKGTGTDRDGFIIGNGVNLYAHPHLKQKAMNAQGNPQAIMNLQAEFMAENMKDQQRVAAKLGIPVATRKPYDMRYISAQMLLADYKWHNGNYNAITSIMSQPTYAQALAAMRKSAAYTHAGDDHRRNVARRNMLRDYFIAKGKL